jgi:hypothetical protein
MGHRLGGQPSTWRHRVCRESAAAALILRQFCLTFGSRVFTSFDKGAVEPVEAIGDEAAV